MKMVAFILKIMTVIKISRLIDFKRNFSCLLQISTSFFSFFFSFDIEIPKDSKYLRCSKKLPRVFYFVHSFKKYSIEISLSFESLKQHLLFGDLRKTSSNISYEA